MRDSLLSQEEIDALLAQRPEPSPEPFPAPSPGPSPVHSGAANPSRAERSSTQHPNLARILDIPLLLTVNLGEVLKPIANVIALWPGAIVEFDRAADEPVDIVLNGKLIARGEVVVIGEYFGVRITQIISPQERIETMF